MPVKRTRATRADQLVEPTVKIKEGLRRMLAKAADENMRSLGGEINYRLTKSFEKNSADAE